MAAVEEDLPSKRQRKAKKTEDGGPEGRGSGKGRAPLAAYLGRLCRVKMADQGEWEPFRIVAYKGKDKQTIELGSAESEDEVVTRTIELRDHSLYVHSDGGVGWGPEADADEATANDPETFVPLLLFTHVGRADAESQGRLLAYSPDSGKHPWLVRRRRRQ
eukprot:scaffold98900_cov66-Phaeocystis_antarctica.AAC.5